MSDATGHHVFFDPTGRRWRRLKLILALTVASLIALGTISWRRVNDPTTLVAGWHVPPPATVSDVPKDVPDIGTGPLGRVVRVGRTPGGELVAIDPLNRQVLHPIVGDDKYGDFAANKAVARQGLKRMFLHAARIAFRHPASAQPLVLEAPLPPELTAFLGRIELARAVTE